VSVDREQLRDDLGRIARCAWIGWATKQSRPRKSWLLNYEDLTEDYKEANRQVGEAMMGNMNARRIFLALKKIDGELTESEEAEYHELQDAYVAVIDRMYPRVDCQTCEVDEEVTKEAGG
jgi:hypothetical protein